MFGDAIKSMMREVLDEVKPAETESSKEKYYSRDAVCKKLDICKATFHNWVNAGRFEAFKIGGRTYVLASELESDAAVEKFKKFKQKPRKY